jgi:hypothetical protein
MDEARRIAYNIAKLPAFLADLDPHQRTIRAMYKDQGRRARALPAAELEPKIMGQLRP